MIISDQAMYEQPKALRIVVKLWNFIASSFILGDGPTNKFKMLYLFFRWKVVLKLPRLGKALPPLQRLAIVFEGHPLDLQFPDDPSFPHILYEVFVCLDYHIPLSKPPECILDVGANMGLTCLFYACRYPEAFLYAFEPNAKNFRYLELNTRFLKHIERHQLGIFSRSGKQRLYLNRFCGMHSLVRPNDIAFEEIETITLDEFLASRGIRHVDVLKIDVEGAEEEILTSTHSLPFIDWITGELHVDVINQTNVIHTLAQEFRVDAQATAIDLTVFTAENRRLASVNGRP